MAHFYTRIAVPFYSRTSKFRRRDKTQGSLPNSDAGLKLLFGLFAGGLIPLRRINGYKDLPTAVLKQRLELDLSEKVDQVA